MGLQNDINDIKEILKDINARLSVIEGELHQAKIREAASIILDLKMRGFVVPEDPPPAVETIMAVYCVPTTYMTVMNNGNYGC